MNDFTNRDQSQSHSDGEAIAERSEQKLVSRRELGRIALLSGAALGVSAAWPSAWRSPLVQVGPLPAHAATSTNNAGARAAMPQVVRIVATSESTISVEYTMPTPQSNNGATYAVTAQWATLHTVGRDNRTEAGVTEAGPNTITGLTPDTTYYVWLQNFDRDNPNVVDRRVNTQAVAVRTFAVATPSVSVSSGTISWTLASDATGIEIVGTRTFTASGETRTEQRSLGIFPSSKTSLTAGERPSEWQTGFTFQARAIKGSGSSAWTSGSVA